VGIIVNYGTKEIGRRVINYAGVGSTPTLDSGSLPGYIRKGGNMWLFDEVLKKYSYDAYLASDKDECFNGVNVDIFITPEYRIEPNDDSESNFIEISKEDVIKALKPLVEKHIKKRLKRFYPKI